MHLVRKVTRVTAMLGRVCVDESLDKERLIAKLLVRNNDMAEMKASNTAIKPPVQIISLVADGITHRSQGGKGLNART